MHLQVTKSVGYGAVETDTLFPLLHTPSAAIDPPLLVMATGAFLFLPASKVASFPLFLSALIILAAGITCLQVAANPYVANLGPPESAASRLNLAQAFNSFGTFVAPFFGSVLILTSTQVTSATMNSYSAAALQRKRHLQQRSWWEC